MVCHRVLPFGRYFFFCISMIFLWLVNSILSCLLMTLSWPCQTYNFSKLQNRVNTELKKIDFWMKKNKLQLNYSKTYYLLLDKLLNRSCSTNFNISLNSNNIKRIKSTKFLGIYIDENLNWSCHIQHLSLQLARYSGLLYRIRNFLDRKTLCMLYYSLIYSRIQCGIVTWGTARGGQSSRKIYLSRSIVTYSKMPFK